MGETVLVSLLTCNNSRWLEEEGDALEDREEASGKVEGLEHDHDKIEALNMITTKSKP